jgi:hypothetical protein
MALSRFQFRLSTLLWITLAVACWFGGMAWKGRADFKEFDYWDHRDYVMQAVLRARRKRIETLERELSSLKSETAQSSPAAQP